MLLIRGDITYGIDKIIEEYPCLNKYVHRFYSWCAIYKIKNGSQVLIEIVMDGIYVDFIINVKDGTLTNMYRAEPEFDEDCEMYYSIGGVFIIVKSANRWKAGVLVKSFRYVMIGVTKVSKEFDDFNKMERHIKMTYLKNRLLKLI